MGERFAWKVKVFALTVVTVGLGGCTTSTVTVAPRLPAHFEKLGPAKGEACSSVVIFAGAEQAVPIMVSSRLQRAYTAAVESVPGATSLADVSLQDRWYFAIFGTVYCTAVMGEGIR